MNEFYMNSMTLASNCHFPQPQFPDMIFMKKAPIIFFKSSLCTDQILVVLFERNLWDQYDAFDNFYYYFQFVIHVFTCTTTMVATPFEKLIVDCFNASIKAFLILMLSFFSKYLASTHLIFCKGYSRSHAVLVSIVVLHSFNRVRPSGISTEKAFVTINAFSQCARTLN